MSKEPIIRALPNVGQFNTMADVLVGPEAGYNDEAAKAYISTVLTVANPEDEHSMGLANAAARHVFAKTQAFEDAFRAFAGYPDVPMMVADRYTVHTGREM